MESRVQQEGVRTATELGPTVEADNNDVVVVGGADNAK